MESNRYGWAKSKGSCGYNVDGPVYAKMQGMVALFAWQNSPDFWTCSVVGTMSCGGSTLEECQIAGEKAAGDSKNQRDRYMSRNEFDTLVNDSTVLGFIKP